MFVAVNLVPVEHCATLDAVRLLFDCFLLIRHKIKFRKGVKHVCVLETKYD